MYNNYIIISVFYTFTQGFIFKQNHISTWRFVSQSEKFEIYVSETKPTAPWEYLITPKWSKHIVEFNLKWCSYYHFTHIALLFFTDIYVQTLLHIYLIDCLPTSEICGFCKWNKALCTETLTWLRVHIYAFHFLKFFSSEICPQTWLPLSLKECSLIWLIW